MEAAKQTGLSKSNLGKMEQAESKTVPTAALNKLLNFYEVEDPETREAMHALARDAKQRGWWSHYKDVLPQMLADFEAEACSFRTYHAQVIPGMLQTPTYADAVFRANKVRDDNEIQQRVAARIARQTILNKVNPPSYQAIIDESTLRRVVGSTEVMREQLQHLIHMASRHNIDIYVLPFTAGAHPATEGTFIVMDFPDPRDVSIAYLENPATSLYLEESDQIRMFNDMFGDAQGCSLNPVQSLSFIQRILSEVEE